MVEVAVLMSSYNGHKYIRQQLDSIYQQDNVSVKVVVRDDGSTDDTLMILEEYHKRHGLTYYQGKNIGPAKSFMQLLIDSPTADYYAFSDEDDVWLADKLSNAVMNLERFDGPALYYCQTQLVDKDLRPLQNVVIHPRGTFGEALVYQFIGGNTMVMNNPLRHIINLYRPTFFYMHDVWIYDVALAVGAQVIFDSKPHILYRQHGNNIVGQGNSWIKEWKKRFIRVFVDHEHRRSRMANEIRRGFIGYMPKENISIVNAFLNARKSLKARISLLRDPRFICSSSNTYFLFRLNVIMNTI